MTVRQMAASCHGFNALRVDTRTPRGREAHGVGPPLRDIFIHTHLLHHSRAAHFTPMTYVDTTPVVPQIPG
jgi:hypothetical protein